MTTPPAGAETPFAMSVRILAGALMAALVFIGVAMFFVLGTEQTPPWWLVVALIALGVLMHFAIEATGYRLAPLEPSLSEKAAETAARTRWQSAMIQRFAMSEFIAIGALVLAFVMDGGLWIYVIGAVVSLVLMAVHVWPGARPVNKSAEALEAGGRNSGLREAFGYPAPGPMQQF